MPKLVELVELPKLKIAVVCSDMKTTRMMAGSTLGDHHDFGHHAHGAEINPDCEFSLLYADKHFRTQPVQTQLEWLETAIGDRPGYLLALSPGKEIISWLLANNKQHRGLLPHRPEFRAEVAKLLNIEHLTIPPLSTPH